MMKTVKALLLILAMMYAENSFGQSKEETIEWLKEKVKKHAGTESSVKGSTRVEIITVSPCEFSYKVVYEDGDYYVTQFDPSSSEWDHTGIVAKAGNVIKIDWSWGRERTSYSNQVSLSNKGVPNLRERFAKALNHLATFCEKKKETF